MGICPFRQQVESIVRVRSKFTDPKQTCTSIYLKKSSGTIATLVVLCTTRDMYYLYRDVTRHGRGHLFHHVTYLWGAAPARWPLVSGPRALFKWDNRKHRIGTWECSAKRNNLPTPGAHLLPIARVRWVCRIIMSFVCRGLSSAGFAKFSSRTHSFIDAICVV